MSRADQTCSAVGLAPHDSLASSSNNVQLPPRQVRWAPDKVVGYTQVASEQQSDRAQSFGDLAEEPEDESQDEGITLALTLLRGRLGCAYYDPNCDKIYFVEDQVDSNEFDLAKLIIEQLLPTTVLSASNTDPNFLSFLETTLSSLPSNGSSASGVSFSAATQSDPRIRLEIRPARDFYTGTSRNMLAQIKVREGAWYAYEEELEEREAKEQMDTEAGDLHDREGVAGDILKRNRALRLEALVNGLENSPLTLGCAGALITLLMRMRATEDDVEAVRLCISGLELMKLDTIMQINSEALRSLQIFEQEAHASMHASRGKEGLSIFNIVNMTHSPRGNALLRQWLIRPSLELDVIEERHETVAAFLRSENVAAADALRVHLKSIKNAHKALISLLSGRGKLTAWTTIYGLLCFSILCQDAALTLSRSRKVKIVDRLQTALDSQAFRVIGQMMNQVIDWETSTQQKGKVCVRPGVDSNLDELRRQLEGLPSLLSQIASDFSKNLPADFIDEISFVYFPQIGYLVRIQPELPLEQLENVLGADFDFQFASEASAYYKDDQCRDLDLHIGDLQSLVADKEIEIVQALLEQVEHIEGSIAATVEVLAEFDCLLALAEAASYNNWTRPRMTEKPVLKVKGGRHPLAELCTPTFVKNDVYLVGGRGIDWDAEEEKSQADEQDGAQTTAERKSDEERSMIILAGANMSGKSVYLKQNALITYLAHVGSFVPADKALVGLTDRIMTRVSTKESITRGASAFMIDLQQISFMLRNCTARSLLIIDEFGKGTETNDGAGLFCGVIESLLLLGRKTPRAAVSTHFQYVFANGLLSTRLRIHLAHMDVLFHDSTSQTTSPGSTSTLTGTASLETNQAEAIVYLYSLKPGLMVSSQAAACAKLFDIPDHVVERANFVTDALSRFDLEAVLEEPTEEWNVDDRRARLREERELEALANRFLEWNLDEMEGDEGEYNVEDIKAKLLDVLGEV